MASSIPSTIALDNSLISQAEDALLGAYNGMASLEYLAHVGLALVAQVQDKHTNSWSHGAKQSLMPVDSHSDEILSVTDLAA